MRRLVAHTIVAAALTSLPSPAAAQPDATGRNGGGGSGAEMDAGTEESAGATVPARIRVVPPVCALDTVDVAEAVRLLRIELVGDEVQAVQIVQDDRAGAEGGASPGEIAVLHLRVAPCGPEASRVEVVVDDAVTRKRVRRVLDVGGVPEGVRPRALALGTAELLRSSWVELSGGDPPEPAVPLGPDVLSWITTQVATASAAAPERDGEPVAPPRRDERPAVHEPAAAPEADPEPDPEPPPTALIDGAASLRAFPANGSSLLGARLGVSFALAPPLPLRVRLEGSAERGRVRVTLGDIDIGLAAGALVLDVTSAPGAPVGVELGPRLEVGYGWASGSPDDPMDEGFEGGSLVVVLSLHTTLRVRLSEHWRALADLHVGHTLAGLDAQADMRSTTGLTGATLSLHLGVGVAL